MDSALILRLIVIGIGIIMLSVDFLLYCRKRLIEKFSFAWGMFSIILILSGAVPKFNVWSRYLCTGNRNLFYCFRINFDMFIL